MFEQIVSLENLFAAWREFRRGKRDKRDVQEFERHLERGVWGLHRELISGVYRHAPYKRFHVFDPKHRIIHKATVRDRLLHHAVYRIVNPLFEHSFIFDSYSCRVGKGTHAAVRRLETFARQVSRNYTSACWALKFDVAKFFDSVGHATLLTLLGHKISCRNTMRLLAEVVGSYRTNTESLGAISMESVLLPPRAASRGIPIGNLTSQLFANVYLDAFDHFIKEQLGVRYYVRYTDDGVIVHHDREYLLELVPQIAVWLRRERGLSLHPFKIEVRKLRQGIDFLGYIVLPHHKVLRSKTRQRMLARVNGQNISSYLGLLAHSNGYALRLQVLKIADSHCKMRQNMLS